MKKVIFPPKYSCFYPIPDCFLTANWLVFQSEGSPSPSLKFSDENTVQIKSFKIFCFCTFNSPSFYVDLTWAIFWKFWKKRPLTYQFFLGLASSRCDMVGRVKSSDSKNIIHFWGSRVVQIFRTFNFHTCSFSVSILQFPIHDWS